MEKLTLNVEELIDFVESEKVVYATNGKRKLFITLYGGFEVWNGQDLVYETMQPYVAIEEFNKIPV